MNGLLCVVSGCRTGMSSTLLRRVKAGQDSHATPNKNVQAPVETGKQHYNDALNIVFNYLWPLLTLVLLFVGTRYYPVSDGGRSAVWWSHARAQAAVLKRSMCSSTNTTFPNHT